MSRARGKTSKKYRAGMTLLLVALLAGCSSGPTTPSQPKDGGTSQVANNTPLKELSVMTQYSTSEPPKPDNIALVEMEKYTGTKLNITWVPSTAYTDKVNVTLSSNALPQVLMVTDHKSPTLVSAVRAGMFWEVGPYLKSYPELSKKLEMVTKNASVDGKLYGIYRGRVLGRNGFIYRQDWLTSLGLKEPKTIDEFYQMIKAFSTQDPDKNGKNDTVGLIMDKTTLDSKDFFTWFGAPNGWEFKDGKVTPDFMTKEYLDALNFMKKLYDEKLINADFPVTQSFRDVMNKGIAGAALSCMCLSMDGSFNTLAKADPNAKIDIVNTLAGPKGERAAASAGFFGMFMFPKSSVKTEADLKKILAYLDKISDEKMNFLLDWGIEGRHHKMENGNPVFTDAKLFGDEINPIKQLKTWDGSSYGTSTPLGKKLLDMYAKNDKIVLHDPTLPLISNTFSERGADLKKIIGDAQVKYIFGEYNLEAWNNAINQWKKQGGDKVIEEFTAEYAKLNK
ncbi:extracellular solute-binding protein [Paenibacillus radicis (ex Xue et al. 2023)]|uniref:Extracellular solute-binding protein n=1 Tax=Paenibacillus radicis (ex Xue et al. 2023) TaxID=2972489 RepID=A0ABT1YST6_9BACL|nr:extracellular solute-binding protein [Paenibacillus radicis (ex Xue et al. 2023)]MCR8635353.1 extracellular solute-binding protein [Paenibacillus radicis (ex Xue et al. 2023)]